MTVWTNTSFPFSKHATHHAKHDRCGQLHQQEKVIYLCDQHEKMVLQYEGLGLALASTALAFRVAVLLELNLLPVRT